MDSSPPRPDENGTKHFPEWPQNEIREAKSALLNETEAATIKKPEPEPRIAYRFMNEWGWEVLGWFIAVLCLVAIIGILIAFNHKALPQWPYQINLNTLISIFSQISSTALLVPLTECISQLKWLWFTRRSRPLYDFESFDSASRGPWPSFLLIWKTRASHLVSLGALLTIVNLAFQPFVQQAVSFPQRLVPRGTASAPTIYNITIDGLQGNNMDNLYAPGAIPPATVSAIYAGLNGGANLSEVIPYCATGNCTWGSYDSIAICANPVANLTHLITRTAFTIGADCSVWGTTSAHICKYTLPNGAYLTGEDIFINATSIEFNAAGHDTIPSILYPGNQTLASIAFPDIPVVLDFFMIYYSPSINNVAAIEASLSFCGQTFNTTVQNEQVNTTELRRWGKLDTSQRSNYPNTWPIVGDPTTLWVSEGYSKSLQYSLAKIFSGYFMINDNGNEEYSSVAVQALNMSLKASQDDVSTLSLFMDEIAVSITNDLRTGAGSVEIEGIMYGSETYVLAVWFWLILPACTVFLTLIFLLATIRMNHNRRIRTWKSSSLAALNGLSKETRAQLGGLTSMAAIEEQSEKIQVRMVADENGWKLSAE